MGFIITALGLAMMIGSLFFGASNLPASIALAVVGFLVIVIGFGMTTASYYRRTSADQAFVRTGTGGSKVVLDGGIMVIPVPAPGAGDQPARR